MKLARRPRVIAALIAMISVLFTQLAVAAYVCPSTQVGQVMEALTKVSEHALHDLSSCDSADFEQVPLCHVQWQVGTQSLDKPELPQVAPFAATTLAVAYADSDPLRPATLSSPGRDIPVRKSAPPLSIQHCCFRI